MTGLARILVMLLGASSSWGSHTLNTQQRRVVASWLAEVPTYRQATDADCDCVDQIRQMQRGLEGTVWSGVPDYHPYQVVGDFNGDGHFDIAVVVVDTTRSAHQFVLAIFNGPFRGKESKPTFLEKDRGLRGQGLFFGPPRPRPYRLLVGPFESDNTGLLLPAGNTYKWDESTDEE